MLRPIPSISKVDIGKNTQPEVPEINRRRDDDYEEKLKLAALLHDQGINPELWQEAEPAPWTAQKRFRETGEAPEDMFVAQGRLYRKSLSDQLSMKVMPCPTISGMIFGALSLRRMAARFRLASLTSRNLDE